MFGEGGENWRTFTEVAVKEGINVYAYAEAEEGALGYISGRLGKTCLIINQAQVPAKKFVGAVNEISEAGGDYLGVVLYNTTDSYLE